MTTKIRNIIDPSGVAFTEFSHPNGKLIVRQNEVDFSNRQFRTRLNGAGIAVSSKASLDKLRTAYDACVVEYPANVAEHSGWCGHNFVLPSGKLLGPNFQDVLCAFTPEKESAIGNFEGWLGSFELMKNNPIAVTATLYMLVPPLLDLLQLEYNPSLEIHGSVANGLNALSMLAASVSGHPDKTPIPMSRLNANLANVQATHNDRALLISDTSFASYLPKAKRDALYRTLVYDMPRTEKGRVCTLIFSETAMLQQLVGQNQSAEAKSRILSIPMPTAKKFGLLDALPEGFVDGQAVNEHIRSNLLNNHGLANERFVTALVNARYKNEGKLIAKINKCKAEFRARVNSDGSTDDNSAAVDSFALIYAAGRLAKSYGCLPKDTKIGLRVLACYKLHTGGTSILSEQSSSNDDISLDEFDDRFGKLKSGRPSAIERLKQKAAKKQFGTAPSSHREAAKKTRVKKGQSL